EVNFQRGCLDAHNDLRQRYGVTPLIWSAELADMAHAWAVKLSDRGRILYPELPGQFLFSELRNLKFCHTRDRL
ncbi:hypothetical protein GCK32_021238, partial [Trichostrongylus colubriformis]